MAQKHHKKHVNEWVSLHANETLFTKQMADWFWPTKAHSWQLFFQILKKYVRKLGQREKKNGENGKVLKVASVSKMHAVRSCTFSRFGLIFDSELPRSQCKKDKPTGGIMCKGYKGNRQLCELHQGKHG